MDVASFAKKFIILFPAYKKDYQEDIEAYGEILGHNFFGNSINAVLSTLLIENKNINLIKKYIDFIEDMYAHGNEDVKNIVEVTILEYLGDDDGSLKNAFTYFSEDLIMASKNIEADLERHEIHIFYKKGNVFADWT